MDKPIYEIPVTTDFPRATPPQPLQYQDTPTGPPTTEFLMPPAPLTVPSAPGAPEPASYNSVGESRPVVETPAYAYPPAADSYQTPAPAPAAPPSTSLESLEAAWQTLATAAVEPAYVEPTAYAEPAVYVEPVAYVEPSAYVEPVAYVEPAAYLQPVNPVEPTAPLVEPVEPPAQWTEQPAEPAWTSTPDPVEPPLAAWSLSQSSSRAEQPPAAVPEPAHFDATPTAIIPTQPAYSVAPVAPATYSEPAPVETLTSVLPLARPETQYPVPPVAAEPVHTVPSSQEAAVPTHNIAPATEPTVPAPAAVLAPPPEYVPTVIDDGADQWRESLEKADPELIAALQEVLLSGASDLHVSANAAPMIRVDGGLRPIDGATSWTRDKVASALHSIMSAAQREQFESELELDFAYTISGNARFRVNIYQQRASLGAAFRLIPTEIKQLHDLGIPESVSRFAQLARGLVLVTGPTGSGKSTTLAAIIDMVNRTRADHIMTVEDPIEFLHQNHKSLINQREVGHDTHSFGAALKHVLRQDPDVILVGELRDLETISVALTAAETGHLVFATLHTQSAAQSIDRIIDVFPPHQQEQVRAQLASTLQGVVTQTLLKKAGGRGRVVATEVLVSTPAINNLVREGKTYQITSMMQAGRELGMHTLDQHLADLVNSGQITSQAAYEKCQDPDTLKRLIHRQESPSGAGMTGSIDFGDSFSGQVK
ncbi:PilT/PilU family type 4a pilus ATPase [Salinibacterium sp. ZJ454]|uniref:type IV pilus twitching motility protein PilT n=1 Tax=Salinibacterium sp. ZJ454 TaxID=2708339 RepID=UPI0024444F0B|nr:PilT/PilU family type 4a pilus ATPase [Salinibacterium sp. ZJ454]